MDEGRYGAEVSIAINLLLLAYKQDILSESPFLA